MKLQKISEIQPTLPLTEFDFMQKYRESFRQSELGRIYSLLPLTELATAIAEKMPAKKPQSNKPMFPLEGSFANQKQHYSAGRIAARNRYSETPRLFFGIHMANAATLASRRMAGEERAKEKKKRRA